MRCAKEKVGSPLHHVRYHGFYKRKSDSKKIQRFLCITCRKSFSNACLDPAYNQNKRRVNYKLKQLLASGMSQRRSGLILNITQKTVARKLVFLSKLGEKEKKAGIEQATVIYIDELETIEHTKCKPLSVAAVVTERRKVLGMTVSRMPAKGHLAGISRKRYGHRPDRRRRGLNQLLREVKDQVAEDATIITDEHPYYGSIIKKHFPQAIHKQYKGAQSAVTGQGELKKRVFDPLFIINHTFAMLRANINRLFRRTWCTTKKKERLLDHLQVYAWYHNRVLTPSF